MHYVDKGGKSNRGGRWGTWQRADSQGFCHGGAGASVSNSQKYEYMLYSPILLWTHLSYKYTHNNDLCSFIFPCRLYAYEVEKSCEMNENLGAGIAVFQGLSNVALNCEPE